MKLYKSLLMMSALAGVALTSCNDDGYWDNHSKKDLANGVTYSFNTASDNYVYEFDEEIVDNEYSVVITRSDAKNEETLDLAVVATDPSAFAADESVYFEAGQNEVVYTIKLAREFELEEEQAINVAIDLEQFGFAMPEEPEVPEIEEPADPGEEATEEEQKAYEAAKKEYDKVMAEYAAEVEAYNAKLSTINKQLSDYKLSYTLTVKKDGAWEDLGNATFTDDWTFSKSGYPVLLQRSLSDPSMYRLVKPYFTASEDLSEDNIVFYVLKAGESLYGVDLTQDGLVYFDMFTSGEKYDDTSTIYGLHPGMFSSRRSEDQYLGSYVKEWQEDGETPGLVVLSPYWYVFDDATGDGMGGWSNYIFDELIQIQFPGYVKKNFSTSVEYTGLYTDLESVQYVLGNVTFGPDVASAKAVLAVGKNKINDAYANMLSDTYTYDLDLEATEIQVPMILNAATDDYTLAIFTFDEEGEMQDYDYTSFSYVGLGGEETWTSLGTGVYTYNLAFAGAEGPIQDEYELFQSDLKPNRFKIANWAASDPDEGTSYDLIFHQDWEGNIIVDECETGASYGTYGPISVMEAYDYFGDTWPYGKSSYDSETKTYHFQLVYFVEAGTMQSWYGEETFEVGASLETKAFKVPSKMKGAKNAKFVSKKQKAKSVERNRVPYVYEPMGLFMRPFVR